MLFILALFFYNIFCKLTVAVDEHVLSVQLEPKLQNDQHYYLVTGQCCGSNLPTILGHSDDIQLQNQHNAYDLVQLKFIDRINLPRPIKYRISIEMKTRNNLNMGTWESPYSTEIQIDAPHKVIPITFANYFKLDISPGFSENSKMAYLVTVNCAGNKHQTEFRTLTKFDTMVVFNSVQRKCEQYDIKMLILYVDEVQRKILSLRQALLLVDNGVTVANGQTHHIYFKNCFTLRINPPLLSSISEHIYHVVVKCHGIVSAQEYRTFTQNSEQVVLNEDNCTAYDIYVTKIHSIMVANPHFVSRNKQTELGVKIPNGHTYVFNYVDQLVQQPMESPSSSSIPSSSSESSYIKEGMKRLSTDIDGLKREVTQMKQNVEDMKEIIDKGLTEIKESLTKKLRNE